ncbi:MAG: thiamine diphosphokinase [Lentihominibacter sp.]|jgi:thiamine pyrophosphokinase
MKVLIITSYIDSPLHLNDIAESCDYIICTDGGINIAEKYGITPDLLLGDFDSFKGELPTDTEVLHFSPEKDYTDLELAVMEALSRGACEIEIAGGIGGRLDHTIANIQILMNYSRHCPVTIRDGRNHCLVLHGPCDIFEIEAVENSYLSLFSLSECCTGVYASGVRYPLSDHTITSTYPLGVSNEFRDDKATLSLGGGSMLIVISKNN